MRIRQLALVAQDLDLADGHLRETFDLDPGFADPGVGHFGLVNRVFALGETFLEVVSPQQEGTTAGRWLEKRSGDGGYMVIVQAEGDDLGFASERKRMEERNVRVVFDTALDDIATLHLHPRDVGGAILSIDRAIPWESWRWAGPDWNQRIRKTRVGSLLGAGIQARNPDAMAQRWSEVLDSPLLQDAHGRPVLELGSTSLRFIPWRDDRGDGLAEIDLECFDPESVLATGQDRGLVCDPEAASIDMAGVRFLLRKP